MCAVRREDEGTRGTEAGVKAARRGQRRLLSVQADNARESPRGPAAADERDGERRLADARREVKECTLERRA